jgi:hypothetical protein
MAIPTLTDLDKMLEHRHLGAWHREFIATFREVILTKDTYCFEQCMDALDRLELLIANQPPGRRHVPRVMRPTFEQLIQHTRTIRREQPVRTMRQQV